MKYLNRTKKTFITALKLFRQYWFNILFLVIVVGILHSFLNFKTAPRKVLLLTPTPTAVPNNPLCKLTYKNQSDFVIQDKIIDMNEVDTFSRIKFGMVSVLVPTDTLSIIDRRYSPELQKIVFVEQERTEDTVIDKVILHDLRADSSKTIYEMKEVTKEGSEYTKAINGVSFSDDSSMIAITTGESIILYHTKEEKLETLFEQKRNDRGIGGVFSLSIPFNWPVNNKIIVREGYYEGNGYSVFDLNSREKTSLPYMSYGFGKQILGIYKDQMIVADNGPFKEPSDGPLTKISLVNINTMAQKLLLNVNGNIQFSRVTNDGSMFFDKVNTEYIPYYYCGSETDIYQAQSTFATLMKLNLNTGEVKELLRADPLPSTNSASNNMTIDGIFVNNNAEDKQILLTMRWGDAIVDFLLNENDPKYLTQIK